MAGHGGSNPGLSDKGRSQGKSPGHRDVATSHVRGRWGGRAREGKGPERVRAAGSLDTGVLVGAALVCGSEGCRSSHGRQSSPYDHKEIRPCQQAWNDVRNQNL